MKPLYELFFTMHSGVAWVLILSGINYKIQCFSVVDTQYFIFAYAANTDFSITSAVLTFNASTSLRCEQVTITDDTILENSEIFFMQLESTDPAVEITLGSAPVTIFDDDCEYGCT